MKRRHFLASAFSALPLIALGDNKKFIQTEQSSFDVDIDGTEFHTKLYIDGLKTGTKIMQLSDTHISMDTLYDREHFEYNNRMRNAYLRVKHYKTGDVVTPFKCFKESLKTAKEINTDLIILTGDIINYPSKTDVAAIQEALEECSVPYKFISGNHDWHYEGMKGTANQLRATWIEKSLLPLYKGDNPLFYNVVLGGINHVLIDNSTYQILPEQLDFLKKQLGAALPIAMYMHIPIHGPGTNLSCGNPKWKENTSNFELEESIKDGNSKATMEFVDLVYKSEKIVGVFAGHEHVFRQIKRNKMNEFTTVPAYGGRYKIIEFLPKS